MDAVLFSAFVACTHADAAEYCPNCRTRRSVYREMAADFVKYSSHPVVADGTSHTLAGGMLVQAACFPDYSGDISNFGAFDLVTHVGDARRDRG